MRRCLLALLVACGASHPTPPQPVEAIVAPVASVPGLPTEPGSARSEHFPAGRGVTLVSDQLANVTRDAKILKAPKDELVPAVSKMLGVAGEPFKEELREGVRFFAVGPKSTHGPWGCEELLVFTVGSPNTELHATDFARCGLPYAEDHVKPYTGSGPKRTVVKLREVLAELTAGAPATTARTRLGPPESDDGVEATWLGIGARDASAPVTCHVLRVGVKVELGVAPLETCGLSWPPPAARFDVPTIAPLDRRAGLEQCANRCRAKEVCVLDQRVRTGAILRTDPDGARAYYPDGYPAPSEMLATCTPIPPTCTTVDRACFSGRSRSPCPSRSGASAQTFVAEPRPHILCLTRVDGP